ncbi:D-amino-acid transaminase, chloroplastic-like isoform X2 [Glycine soja]|uniref:D-amino-acid transaminase, chloroplastic isoform E n=1 Tax=Glycine soja TaxID=3848 RepID=A0A445K6K1_GLYSO|nr:D-amino-acid transaminase, chloroplastic-like isoform X2 [Glycine soja]RZC06422.1 D-amino-acid transaminase, chloroplastic isoform E [Glycine soja]|eukprot:XP_014631733.1 D-amino-acid transaminase, chloroplastic isoform X2 [Glycine max]
MKAVTNCNQSGCLAYSRTEISDVPLLSCSEAMEKLKSFREKVKGKQQFLAMYSSIFGGITTDPAAMVIPMDDHMVHRGHGVFDTTAIIDGYLYELDQHLDRFIRNGTLRYWLSAGPGDFDLSPSGCHKSCLYAITIQDLSPINFRGVKVVTSNVPIKPPQFATTKSVNYLPNVLSKMEAEELGAFVGIWLDSDGFVAEGPSMNVAFVTKEKELVMPLCDKILSGCTAKRVLTLAESLVREGKLCGIRMKNVSVEEGKNADEMMLLGSGIMVRSVVQWDEQIIGCGKEGPITQTLLNLVVEDMKSTLPAVGTPVPY